VGLPVDCFFLSKGSNDKQIKETHKTLASLGLSKGAQIKVTIGEPKEEGIYNIKICMVALVEAGSGPENEFFSKEELSDLKVKPSDTGAQLKQTVADLYCSLKNKEISVDAFWMRNPNYDFGNIIKDSDELDSLLMHDGKELYMHIKQPANFLEHDS